MTPPTESTQTGLATGASGRCQDGSQLTSDQGGKKSTSNQGGKMYTCNQGRKLASAGRSRKQATSGGLIDHTLRQGRSGRWRMERLERKDPLGG